ncbi:hypothetical protein YB2330_005513 [Saitoella coloradoensis]
MSSPPAVKPKKTFVAQYPPDRGRPDFEEALPDYYDVAEEGAGSKVKAPEEPEVKLQGPVVGEENMFFDHDDALPPSHLPAYQAPAETDELVSSVRTDRDGNVSTHAPILSSSPLALHDFVWEQAQIPPQASLRIKGWHTENVTNDYIRPGEDQDGSSNLSNTRTVIDFDMVIPLSHLLKAGHGRVFAWRDEFATYRGTAHVCSQSEARRGVGVIGRFLNKTKGFILRQPAYDEIDSMGPVSLMEACSEYVSSTHPLRSFHFTKHATGWSFPTLTRAFTAAIRSTYYREFIDITLESRGDDVIVRPPGRLNRTLANKWIKALMFILIIPAVVLWILRRWWGARWSTHGVAFRLNEGMSEGEFFRRWEGEVKRGVQTKRQGTLEWVNVCGSSTSQSAR